MLNHSGLAPSFLILVVVGSALLGLTIPTARSQAYTTFTTVTFSSVNRVWTMTGDNYHCTNEGFAFTAAAGNTITGTIVSNNPSMVAYILTEQELSAWEAGNSCDPRQGTPPVGVEWTDGSRTNLLQSVNLDWTAPVAGQYFVLVETFSFSSIVTVDVSTPSNGVVTQVLSVLATSSEAATPQEISSAQTDNSWMVAAIVVAVALVAIAIVITYVRRKSTKEPEATPAASKPASESALTRAEMPPSTDLSTKTTPKLPNTMYCSKCGVLISRDSGFCKECGSKQT